MSSNANIIAQLSGEYRFKVVTRNTEYTSTTPYAGIEPDSWTQQQGFEGYYISGSKLTIAHIKKILRETAYDLIYVNGTYSLYFSLLPLILGKKTGKPVVVGSRGMLSAHSLGVKSLKKNLFIHIARYTGLYRHMTFHATNEEEAATLRGLFGKETAIKIAPNLPRKIEGTPIGRPKIKNHLQLINISRISPEKNNLFGLEMLLLCSESIQASEGEIDYYWYGPVYNQSYWEQCQELIQKLPASIRVHYEGSLPPTALPEKLNASHFLFMPTRGENFGHTILESMQAGCPVIISDKTPWRQLEEKGAGWDIPLDESGRYVEVIRRCLAMEQEEYDTLSRRTFEYARSVTEDAEAIAATRRIMEGGGRAGKMLND